MLSSLGCRRCPDPTLASSPCDCVRNKNVNIRTVSQIHATRTQLSELFDGGFSATGAWISEHYRRCTYVHLHEGENPTRGAVMRHPYIALSVLSCLIAGECGPARADERPMLDEVSVSAGIFSNDLSANMRVDGGIKGSGTAIDFSRDLGQGGTHSLPFISATWRPWDRHEFELAYFHDDNDRSRTLNRSLVLKNQTFTVGSTLSSKFSLDAGSLAYRYWLWIGDNGAFGLSAGLQTYSFDLRLKASANVSGPSGGAAATRTVSASASTNIPDPSIGISYRYQMANWARFVADAGAFKANIGDIDAKLYNARLGVEFYPWQSFGVVTQYAFNKISADIDKSGFSGHTSFKFNGFQLLVKVRF